MSGQGRKDGMGKGRKMEEGVGGGEYNRGKRESMGMGDICIIGRKKGSEVG